jgi:uncharacterized protein (DUF1697 family)
MKTYISILRGINVSGQKKILMADLKKLYESLGFINVQTYIQSGNIIFDYQNKENNNNNEITLAEIQQNISLQIADKIAEQYDFQVPVIIRNVEEMESCIKNNPFIGKYADLDKFHVSFLSQIPTESNIDKLNDKAKEGYFGDDEYLILGKEVYLYCPNGYGITKLSNNFLENKLKVIVTTRNWKTVNELLRIAKNS